MRLGISGHQDISPEVVAYVRPILIRLINEQKGNVVGVSSLAAGADQLFATLVLDHGGSVHAIIPCREYERTFSDPDSLNHFKSLLARAREIETLAYSEPSEEAFLEAGHRVVDNAEILIAVWDGQPAAGKGGTADIVDYARRCDIEVRVIWPAGVSR